MNKPLTKKENSLLELLNSTKEILDSHYVEFWLEGGTLLGAARNGRFIPWDRDIDLGMWAKKISQKKRSLIAKNFIERGFRVIIYKNWMHISKDFSCWLDFDFYQFKNDYAVYPAFYANNFISRFLFRFGSILLCPFYYSEEIYQKSKIKRLTLLILYRIARIVPEFLRSKIAYFLLEAYRSIGSKYVPRIAPSKYFENLSTIKFYNLEFNVPHMYKDYLTYKYGEDWMTPKKEWIAERDDGMVKRFLDKPIF